MDLETWQCELVNLKKMDLETWQCAFLKFEKFGNVNLPT
jgi:hypothetical protein